MNKKTGRNEEDGFTSTGRIAGPCPPQFNPPDRSSFPTPLKKKPSDKITKDNSQKWEIKNSPNDKRLFNSRKALFLYLNLKSYQLEIYLIMLDNESNN